MKIFIVALLLAIGYAQTDWVYVNTNNYEYEVISSDGYCADWRYLPDPYGAYPEHLGPSDYLYNSDKIRECMNRCLSAVSPGLIEGHAFYVRTSDSKCGCSTGLCLSTKRSSTGYTSYRIRTATGTRHFDIPRHFGDFDIPSTPILQHPEELREDNAIQVNDFDEVEIVGHDNMVFVGNFPELKLCEGSSNEGGHGSVACCIVVGPVPHLKGNCAESNGRRQLTQCPAGFWNIANACDQFQAFCHNYDAINSCTSCAHCTQSKLCPECYVSQLSHDLGWNRRLLTFHLDGSQLLQPHWNGEFVVKAPWDENHEIAHGVQISNVDCNQHEKPCRKKLHVKGDRNLVFIGNFPKLKLCEGSGNKDAGQATCCVLFKQQAGNQQTQVSECASVRRALKDFNEECPSGTFNIRSTCEERDEWCHDIDGPINGCMDCRACPDLNTCPTCASDRRKI